MSRDKVTVDEPLISTDVDSLIRTIAEKKRIPLNDLRQISKIDKKTMDKWIAVLEDEGYITVEYGIRGTFILWRDIEEVPKGEKNFRTEGSKDTQIHPEPAEAVFSEAAKQPTAEEKPIEPVMEEASEEGPVVEMPLADDPEPEELLSQYLARKKSESQEDSDSIKSNILTRLKGKDDTTVKEAAGGDDSPESPEEPEDSSTEEAAAGSPMEDAAEEAPEPEAAEVPEPEEAAEEEKRPKEAYAPPRATLRPDKAPSADVRELMNSYVAEINKEKVKIEALKKEREVLYREKFATMEGKMQADIVVLTEKILEKQTKVAELKERVLELPDKVDELSKLQEQMASLRKESRDALQRTKSKAEEFLGSVERSKADVHGKIADIDTLIEAQSGRIRELEKLSVSLDARAPKIKSALEAAKAEADELTAAIGTLGTDLQVVEQERGQISGMTEEIKQAVSDRGAELESLEGELEGISRVEQWVQEYVHDYEQKIDGIEQYVEKSDEELAELKEEAESLYMKKYLGELEDITEAYESELGDAAAREQEIDRKIAESKTRITDLVGESQEMIKKLKGEIAENPQKDYGILVARVKAKTSRTKNMLTGKEQERAKLAEESKKVRRTLAVARQSGRAPPPAPKAAPKKAVPSKPQARSVPAKKKRK